MNGGLLGPRSVGDFKAAFSNAPSYGVKLTMHTLELAVMPSISYQNMMGLLYGTFCRFFFKR